MQDEILNLLRRRPFIPFEYVMKDGTRYPVTRLLQTAPSRKFAGYYSDTLKRMKILDYKDIAAIEDLKAAPAV